MVTLSADTWVPVLLIFGATASASVAAVLLWELVRDTLRRRSVHRRLAAVVGDPTSGGAEKEVAGSGLLTGSDSALRALGISRLADLSVVRRVENVLESGGVESSVGAFLLTSAASGLGLGGLVLMVTGVPFVAALAFSAGLLLPYVRVRFRINRVRREFEEQLPESLDLLTRAIRAGHPLTAGMRMVAQEGPSHVAKEFRKTMEEHRFGLPFEDALLGMVDRVDLVDVRIFATAILIQRESGGNLAEILDKLGRTIRDRFSIRRQLRVYTAQGRMSGYVLGALPIVVGSLMHLIEPEYVGLLFSGLLGRALLVGAVVLQLLGFLWIRKIVNIEI